jgi:diguanylate cyclase (GGDEF)-like protein
VDDEDKFSVLIVDDEKTNIDILSAVLKQDYTIYVAKSGQGAMKRAKEEAPDIILLDILMPDMDGFDVLRRLKEDPATLNIPIIFITGLDDAEDEEKGLALGAVDYIKKPFNTAIVLARIRTQLQILKHIRTIERLGTIDALTNILNRRGFDKRIREEWRRTCRNNTAISFMMIDADNFKTYNDTYGHPQGDVLLQTLARILSRAMKRPTDIAARLGGEEFGVLLSDTGMEGAVRIAENIRAEVEAAVIPRATNGEPTSITVSIGVTSVRPVKETSTAEELENSIRTFIRRADNLLYKAKAAGRNKVISESE